MLFGAHVSSSGGISNAIDRGLAIGCESLQVFTHNPRTWAPINHKEEEIAACEDAGVEFIELQIGLDGLSILTKA